VKKTSDRENRVEAFADAAPSGLRTARGVVLLTGASSGIGLVSTLALVRAGFHVIATVRSQAKADALLAQAPPGTVTTALLDLADPRQPAETAACIGWQGDPAAVRRRGRPRSRP